MKNFLLAILALSFPISVQAEKMTIQEWIDSYIKLCVGSGSKTIVEGKVDANAGISLRRLGPNATVSGQLHVAKTEFSLLEAGISNAMSGVAADQADKVRECVAPIRAIILEAMKKDLGVNSATYNPRPELIGRQETKVLIFVAKTAGFKGRKGQIVDFEDIKKATGMEENRLKEIIRNLQDKNLVYFGKSPIDLHKGPEPPYRFVSLSSNGEDYVTRMDYSKSDENWRP